jgi:hypothetical protein
MTETLGTKTPLDTNAVGASLYNNSNHVTAAPKPTAASTLMTGPSAPAKIVTAPQSEAERKASSIYNADTKAPYRDVFAPETDAQKLSKKSLDEIFGEEPGNKAPEDGTAKPDDAAKADAAKTPAEIKAAATALATDLALDPSDEISGEFAETAVSLGLGKEGAQKLVALDLKHREQAWDKISDDWTAATIADPGHDADIKGAKMVLRKFGSPNLERDLGHYRFGNHPGLVKLLGNVARALKL